jgi:hypothetical protein
MPVQIQGDVTPEYTTILTISDTGEVLTEAQIYDTTLALANRIEFVRQLVPEASDNPEAFGIFREEFWMASADNGILYADNIWRYSDAGSPSISHGPGTFKNPGQLVINLPPTGSGGSTDHGASFYIGTETGDPFTFDSVESCVVVCKADEDVGSLLGNWGFGFVQNADELILNGGTDSIQIFRNKAVSAAQWTYQVRAASVVTDTGVFGTYTDEEFHVFRIVKNSSNDWDVYLNGALELTIDSSDIPSAAACTFRLFALHSTTDDEIETIYFDHVSIRSATGDRSGA